MKKTKKNFTLVELLCAVALVVILAGIGFSAYSYASHRGKEAATRSLITRLSAGLETLKTKHGFYPATTLDVIEFNIDSTGLITKVKFGTESKAYEIDTTANDPAKQRVFKAQMKDFLAVVDGESLKKYVNSQNRLTDAWGEEIYYCYPGKFNTTKFDIVAPGADGEFGRDDVKIKAADIKDKWQNKYNPKSEPDANGNTEWACDDIANFDQL